MISFVDSEITQILPDSLKNIPEVRALSYALNQAIRKLVFYSKRIGGLSSIEYLPESILDLVAVELRVQNYEESLPIELKKTLLKHSLIWYCHAGTPAAVSEVVSLIFGGGRVTEWFEYGGEPYRFKVSTKEIMNPEALKRFYEVIHSVKNTRSHLDGFDVERTVEHTLYYSAGFIQTKHIQIG